MCSCRNWRLPAAVLSELPSSQMDIRLWPVLLVSHGNGSHARAAELQGVSSGERFAMRWAAQHPESCASSLDSCQHVKRLVVIKHQEAQQSSMWGSATEGNFHSAT